MTDISDVPMAEWAGVTARDVARTDIPPAEPTEPVDVLAERMRSANIEAVAVTADNEVIGVVTMRDLLNVEVLLDRLENESS